MLYYFDDENKMSIDLTAPSKSSDDDENTSEEVKSEVTEKSIIDTFVESFNELSETLITNRVKFDPKDKESGHYRTEYRLSAWDGSVGETASISKLSGYILSHQHYSDLLLDLS